MAEAASIRVATRADIPTVLAVWARAGAHGAIPDTSAALEALLAWDEDALLLAELDGEVVGTLIAAWDGWRGNMYRLAVLPEQRRRGVALRLIAAAHERLRRNQARRVTALVRHQDAGAAAVWSVGGYERDEEVSRLVRKL